MPGKDGTGYDSTTKRWAAKNKKNKGKKTSVGKGTAGKAMSAIEKRRRMLESI